MISFYKDVLDGPLYFIVLIISIILLMAIIGYVMEKKKLQKEYNDSVASIEKNTNVSSTDLNQNDEVITNQEDEVMVSENAATNAEIPSVLDLNQVDAVPAFDTNENVTDVEVNSPIESNISDSQEVTDKNDVVQIPDTVNDIDQL